VLGRHVPLGLEQLGQGRVLGLDPLGGARHADRGQPGPHWELPGDERRPPGGAAGLGVVVGQQHALGGDPVDVGRPSPHDPAVVGTDIKPADVVGQDQQHVRPIGCHHLPPFLPHGSWPSVR
jgi:hypothetical protein